MKPLDVRTRQYITDVLTSLMATEGERRALLILALFDHPLLNQLDYTGSAQAFIATLIDKLFQFGKLDDGRPALWAVMETAREQVGLDRKHLIDALRPAFELPPPPRRDRLFISYSRKNEREAQRIVSNLKDAGLRVWYDREKIKAGTEWWASIERGIFNADYFVFCLSTASIRSQVARDELLTARRHNKPIFAIMLEDCLGELYDKEFAEREGFAEISWLPSLHIINFTQPDRYGDSLRELIQSLPGYALPDSYDLEQIDPRDLPNPFRGLEAFLEVDAPYFAGREDAIQEILTHLRDVSKPRLLAVVGASGSGKSSLVQAGVIPALRRELPFWETLIIKPGSSPLNELADRLQERLGTNTEQTRERLREQITAIDDIVSELTQGKPDDARFVLVIDQFEELFTLTGDDERQQVLERLLYAVNQPNGRVQILITMRADFFDTLSTVPELARLVRENLDIATEMTPDQLRRSIERPARQVGVSYEDGLVEQILEDVRSQPGSLPLLQYALKELFERKIGRRMTLDAYDAIKGVKGALATRAEAIYTDLSPVEQDALRRILLRLVEVGEDTVSRRRVVRSDLRFTGMADETVQRVLDRLTASEARLLVASAPVDDNDPTNDGQIFYEVSHEALLTHWQRLEGWIAENRGDLRLSSDILTLARVWEGTGRSDTSYLLTGGRLIAAQEWLERGDATKLQRDFVDASLAYQAQEIARLERLTQEANEATQRADNASRQAETAAQQAAIATEQAEVAKQEADLASKRAIRNRTIAGVVGVIAFILAAGASLIGANAVNDANLATTREASANIRVANANEALTAVPPTLTQVNQQVIAAEGQADVANTQVANANAALTAVPPTLTIVAQAISTGQAQLSDVESQRLATLGNLLMALPNGNNETVVLLGIRALTTADTQAAWSLLHASADQPNYSLASLAVHTSPVVEVVELSDGRLLSWALDSTLRLWEADGTPGPVLEGHTSSVEGALELSDGRLLSWALDNTLRLWEADGTPGPVLEGHTSSVEGALELSDSRLLSWSDDETLRLWEADGKPGPVLEGHTSSVEGALELSDGRLLSWAQFDNIVRLWEADGKPGPVLEGHTDYILRAVELSDGRLLSWSDDETLRLWEADGTPGPVLEGHTSSVAGAVELSDGRLLSWALDSTLRLWEADGTPGPVLEGHTDYILRAVELSDGRLLSWALDSTLRLWEADGTPGPVLEGHTATVWGAVELSDGRLLSWALDSTLRLWEADGTPGPVLEGHTDYVAGAVELGDGRLLSWSSDETLRLWEADSRPDPVLEGHTSAVRGVVELSDGRLLSWDRDSILRLWEADGTPGSVLEGHTANVLGAVELSDGRLLSWANYPDTTPRLWEADGTPGPILEGHTDYILGMVELSDGRLLSWAWDSTLRLWETDGTPGPVLEGHTSGVKGAVELSDSRLLSWALDSTLRLWEADGTPGPVLEGHTSSVEGALELSDDRLLSWSVDDTLRLWEADGTLGSVLEGHTATVWGAVELSNGRLLSWAWDNTLRLWEADGTPGPVLEGHTANVWGAVELSNGRLLSWSYDETLRLWEADGTPGPVLKGHNSSVEGALELSDGRLLSWAEFDNILRLWEADGTPGPVLEGHTDHVVGAVELSDTRLLSWSGDGTPRLWSLNRDSYLAFACTRVVRDFTAQERQQFGILDEEPTCPQFTTTDNPMLTPFPSTSMPFPTEVIPVWTPIAMPTASASG